jgi:hypothetical protein
MQEMFEAAHKDPQLKRRLLANPKAVAKEWDVELGDREVERLTKLGAFTELCHEARFGRLFRACDPTVCYPSTLWLHTELVELVRDITIFYPPEPIGYPGPIEYPIWPDPIFYPVGRRIRRGPRWQERRGRSPRLTRR